MAEQALTSSWAALTGTSAQNYNLQNLSRYRVHIVTSSSTPAATVNGKVLYPMGHYLSVGAASPSSGESIWVRSEAQADDTAGLGIIEYS